MLVCAGGGRPGLEGRVEQYACDRGRVGRRRDLKRYRRLALVCASAVAVLLLAFAGVAWTDISAVEGQSFSG